MTNSLTRRFARILLLAGSLLACGAHAAEAGLSGTAAYRERMALPPNAVFEATLEDVSRAGAPAERIGSVRLDPAGQTPFRFTIQYDPARIVPAHRYAVRARITVDNQLWFTTDTLVPVLTRGAPDTVALQLKRVAPQADASLLDTYWKLVTLNGEAIVSHPGTREPYLTLNSKAEPGVTGFGGCNRFMGPYTLEDKKLKFGNMAATMMACLPENVPEPAFFAALDKVRSWRIKSQRLSLLDEAGQIVAEFDARYMR